MSKTDSCVHCGVARGLHDAGEHLFEALRSDGAMTDDIQQLMRFYSVSTLEELVRIQSQHIERLQAKLPPLVDEQPGYVPREG